METNTLTREHIAACVERATQADKWRTATTGEIKSLQELIRGLNRWVVGLIITVGSSIICALVVALMWMIAHFVIGGKP